jgi:hypothetical protein
MTTLRERQLEAVVKMLDFNENKKFSIAADGTSVQWKVLIYDHLGEQVIGQLLRYVLPIILCNIFHPIH